MLVETVRLQPETRHRLLPPGVTGLQLAAMLEQAGISSEKPAGENLTETLFRLARPLLDPPDKFILAWHYLDDVRCLWLDGGNTGGADDAALSAATGLPVICGGGGMYAAEEGGLGMLEELECRGMVCDLGQTIFKISWAERRWAFPRDTALLPLSGGAEAHAIPEKGAQRRALRRFIADSLRAVLAESDAGTPEGVIFALPSALDRWGQPAGSSYIGMSMDTQLVTDALELAGLPDVRHWLVNDAELAAASAVFDERVIQHGKALVFALGTAVGCALADPMAAALHYMESDMEA